MRQDGFNLTCSVFDTFTKITGSRENYLDLQMAPDARDF